MGYYGRAGVVYGVKEFDVYGLEGLGGLEGGCKGDRIKGTYVCLFSGVKGELKGSYRGVKGTYVCLFSGVKGVVIYYRAGTRVVYGVKEFGRKPSWDEMSTDLKDSKDSKDSKASPKSPNNIICTGGAFSFPPQLRRRFFSEGDNQPIKDPTPTPPLEGRGYAHQPFYTG